MSKRSTLHQFTSTEAWLNSLKFQDALGLNSVLDRIMRFMIVVLKSRPISRQELQKRYFDNRDMDKAADGGPPIGHSNLSGTIRGMYCMKQREAWSKRKEVTEPTVEAYDELMAYACDFPENCRRSTKDDKCMGLLAVAEVSDDEWSSVPVQKLVPLTKEGRTYLRNQGGQVTMGI